MNHADSQLPGAPNHVYLLQMDSSINLSSSDQALPLHLLDNSLEFGRNQYFLPIPSKQRDGQDQLQVILDSCQEPAKIMGLLVDSKNYPNIQNLLPIRNHQPETLDDQPEPRDQALGECSSTEESSTRRVRREFSKPELNIKVENNSCGVEPEASTQTVKNYVHISDRIIPPRALAVLPSVLQIQRRHIIATRRTLPMRARFGPVQGIKHKISQSEAVELVLIATSNKKPLFLTKDDNNVITHIDITDKDKSNWIGLLPLGDQKSANAWLYEENYELYAITTEIIPSRKPIMLGYSKKYADDYGLIGPTKDIEKEPPVQKPWWCYECQRALPSANMLQRHVDMIHKEDKPISRRRYRCRHCTRTFSRLFSLRRHIICLHSPDKLDKRSNTIGAKAEPQINLNTSMCSEDNRMPSDESFQNYSNGLDFSTNLFDTDRIPSLDISGNSRSDNDFNPYFIGYRDENGLSNDSDFLSTTKNSQKLDKRKQSKPAEKLLVPCPYCKQSVVKEKRRRHVSECSARRFECECKKVFTNKNQLANHIFTVHSSKIRNKKDNDNTPAVNTCTQGPTPYTCEQCQHPFKRRGMLVNHLWRVHNTVSTRVPLERRVCHYPCVMCPKLYRTAAKRDRHVRLHHPGAEEVRAAAVEGGTRVVEPAACGACPRQYATRAKLLQHQRAHHPHLVPPPTNKNKMITKTEIAVNSIIGN